MADIKAEYLACPIRHVVSRFGDKWSMLVLYMLYKSETGVLRFNEIRKLMSDCSQKMLSQTLKNLEQSHLVHREVYPEVPPRVEYSLTDTGRSLMPVLTDLIAWGQQHFIEDEQEKLETARMLGNRYNPNDEENLQKEIESGFARMLMIRFDIEHLTGKEAIELVRQRNI